MINLKEETRGIIEKQIDNIKYDIENLMGDIQEVTPIQNEEEFTLGYIVGYLRKFAELAVLITEAKNELLAADEEEIRRILVLRTPELRKKLMQYLNR